MEHNSLETAKTAIKMAISTREEEKHLKKDFAKKVLKQQQLILAVNLINLCLISLKELL